jgi:hypothetical protein
MATNPKPEGEAEHTEEDIDWDEYAYRKTQREKPAIELDLTDYAALFLASLQTIFLPLVILSIVLLGFGLILGIIF